MTELDSHRLRRRLLAWYRRYGRQLPWRAALGTRPDPYAVWLSEVMLQQTRVAAATPYIMEFLRRWPDVHVLSSAPLEEVLTAWAGLGYYARARNLHRCAGIVANELGGAFPTTEAGLLALPGVGPYTAAAVSAIAFGRPAAAVDGNVERVLARLCGITMPLPEARPTLRKAARTLVPLKQPGDWAQALMDLGATVCKPRNPDCPTCPWSADCLARATKRQLELPRRIKVPPRPVRFGVAFWLKREDGQVLVRRRPPNGLLGGMLELPGTPWGEKNWSERELSAFAPARVQWQPIPGKVRHTFTHFQLELSVFAGSISAGADAMVGQWVQLGDLGISGFPTVMKKAVDLALANAAQKTVPSNCSGMG